MADAKRDGNHIPVTLGISSTDGTIPLMFTVDPSTSYLLVSVLEDTTTSTAAISDKRDENFVPTAYGISSVDGVTLVPIRTTINGSLLAQFI